MPIPALNIIATQDTVRNSGSSSSRPSGMLPNRPSAIHSTNRTKPEATNVNSQPAFVSTQPRASPDTVASPSVSTKPHVRNATAITAVIPKTYQSRLRLLVSASSSIGTSRTG